MDLLKTERGNNRTRDIHVMFNCLETPAKIQAKRIRIVHQPSNSHQLLSFLSIKHPKMVVKIRLARFGKRNAPFYNIVVAQARYVQLLLYHCTRSIWWIREGGTVDTDTHENIPAPSGMALANFWTWII